jgi:hypothetical protein
MVSSLTSMRGGLYVCTMDRGRELLLFLPAGLSAGESFTAVGDRVPACSGDVAAVGESGTESRFCCAGG